MQKYIPLIARIFLAAIFIKAGLDKLTNLGGTQQAIASKGLPLAGLLVILTILVELLGGLSVLLGYQARWGALALFLFLIPATLLFHTGAEQVTQFLKNLAIMGGLLMVYYVGSGPYSLDTRIRFRRFG